MGYYDGNTVSALWNFAMSDNSFNTGFGPSTPGALNLASGQTHGATPSNIHDNVANGTVIGDPEPTYDDCGKSPRISMTGKNIGSLLNEKGITSPGFTIDEKAEELGTRLVLPPWLESMRKDLEKILPQVHLPYKEKKEQQQEVVR